MSGLLLLLPGLSSLQEVPSLSLFSWTIQVNFYFLLGPWLTWCSSGCYQQDWGHCRNVPSISSHIVHLWVSLVLLPLFYTLGHLGNKRGRDFGRLQIQCSLCGSKMSLAVSQLILLMGSTVFKYLLNSWHYFRKLTVFHVVLSAYGQEFWVFILLTKSSGVKHLVSRISGHWLRGASVWGAPGWLSH